MTENPTDDPDRKQGCPATRAEAWMRENSDAIAVEAACIETKGITGSGLAQNYPAVMEVPQEVRHLVELCKTEMLATEVWLFGSRARSDNHDQSDFDILAVIPDDAPEDIDTPRAAFRLRRRSKAHADLFTLRVSDFIGAADVPNTISYAVAPEGVRLDV